MTFNEWLKDRKPEIEKVMRYNPNYIWAYFENAYEHGKSEADNASQPKDVADGEGRGIIIPDGQKSCRFCGLNAGCNFCSNCGRKLPTA